MFKNVGIMATSARLLNSSRQGASPLGSGASPHRESVIQFNALKLHLRVTSMSQSHVHVMREEPSTEDILQQMLTENTGRHMLDSGGTPRFDDLGSYLGSEHGYGRNWERNRDRSFESEPASVVDFRYGIDVTHNVYHWLKERVSHDGHMQRFFDRFCLKADPDREEPWLQLMEQFPDWLRHHGRAVTGLYGDGDPFTINTYNAPDLLSQVLQFTYFEMSDPGARWGDAYVLLQIHGGCDVRGGYTAPRAFRVMDDGAYMLNNADGRIFCNPRSEDVPGQLDFSGQRIIKEPHWWSTDDAYHWYADGGCGLGAGTQLEQYDRKEIDNRSDWERGILCVDPDGRGYCPKCGGLLEATLA